MLTLSSQRLTRHRDAEQGERAKEFLCRSAWEPVVTNMRNSALPSVDSLGQYVARSSCLTIQHFPRPIDLAPCATQKFCPDPIF
jgi:hypothetical protein